MSTALRMMSKDPLARVKNFRAGFFLLLNPICGEVFEEKHKKYASDGPTSIRGNDNESIDKNYKANSKKKSIEWTKNHIREIILRVSFSIVFYQCFKHVNLEWEEDDEDEVQCFITLSNIVYLCLFVCSFV